MKLLLIVAAVLALSAARPQDPKDATITQYVNEVLLDGYNFAFQTSDGTSRQENAELVNKGTDNEALIVKGSVTWRAADGQEYTLNYVADNEGFKPSGAHLAPQG